MHGHPTIGLPFASGFGFAHNIVGVALKRLGCRIAEAFHLPTLSLLGN